MKKFIVLFPIMMLVINVFTSCSAIKNSSTSINDDVYLDPVADRSYFYDDKKVVESGEKKIAREVNREAYNNSSYSSFNSTNFFQSNLYPNNYLNLGFGVSSMFGVNPMFPGYGIYNAYQLPGSYFSNSYYNGLMPFYSGGLTNYTFMNDPFFMNSMAYNNPYSFYNNGFYSPYNNYNSIYGYSGLMNNFFWSSPGNTNPNYINNNVAHYGPRVSHSGANSQQLINPSFRGERRTFSGADNNTDHPRPVVRSRGETVNDNYNEPIINSSPSINPNSVKPRSQQSTSPVVNEQQPVKGKKGRIAEFFNTPQESNDHEWNNSSRDSYNYPNNSNSNTINSVNPVRGSGNSNNSGGNNVIRPRR